MNVTLPPESESVIQQLIASGSYASPDEVIARALEFFHAAHQQTHWTDAELQKGIDQLERGETVPYNLEKIKAQVAENLRNGIKVRPHSAALPPLTD
ncbi:MAG: hypothetical protein HC866_25905 [Leptolyngbyaceae cyanobacterium RU_5_1]|nr:hypothetical protein [Leptolyngbyaceae cyanobacterium RU_5_1]